MKDVVSLLARRRLLSFVTAGLLTAGLLAATPPAHAASATVTGTVSSSNGSIYSGSVWFYTDCEAYADDSESAYASFEGTPYSATLPTGTYKVRIVPDGGYGAVDSWHSAKSTCAAADTVTISGNGTQNLVAIAGSNVTGGVSSSKGPVDSGFIAYYASCADYEDFGPAAYDFFGSASYSLMVPDGTYKVFIDPDEDSSAVASWHSAKRDCASADTVTVNGDATKNVVALAGSKVTGTVSSSRGLVSSGTLEFYASCTDYDNGDSPAAVTSFTAAEPYAVTVADGTYKVLITPDEGAGAVESWHSAKTNCASADTVSVSGDVTRNLAAIAGFTATGTVSSSNGAISGGYVEFYANCQAWNDGDEAGYSSIDGGNYVVTVPSGTYKVRIEPWQGYGAATSWHSAKADCASADTVTVTSDVTLPLVARSGSNVSGTVSSANGTVGAAEVVFYATCQDWAADNATAYGYYESGYPYVVTVPNGSYRVHIEPVRNANGAIKSWHSAKLDCASADVVTVAGAGTVDLIAATTSTPSTPPPVTPNPTPSTSSPPAPPTPVAQSAAAPVKKLKHKASKKLPAATAQGAPLTWKSKTKKVCSVKKGKVKGLKKGKCKLQATAPALAGYNAFDLGFTIKIT